MTYFVGVDIAKYDHVACIVNLYGEVITDPFTFKNTIDGFQLFLKHISKFNRDEVYIGFESTSHYHENFAYFLTNHSYTFELINPILSKRFRSLNLRDVKNDNVDAITIASYLIFNQSRSNEQEFQINELVLLARERNRLIKNRAKEYTSLTAYLDRVFPELKPHIGRSLYSKGFLELLKAYSTAKEIKETRVDALFNRINRYRRIRNLDEVKFIKELARNSVGFHSNSISLIIKNSINQIEFLTEQINVINEALITNPLVEESPLHQIPGMGSIQIAYIISVIQNITRFDTPGKLLAYAGLDPKIRQSGQFTASSTRMSKRGSKLLRYAIIWTANNVRNNSDTMNEFYLKKRSEGKSHYNALGHCSKKVVNYIFYILKNPDKEFILK